MDCVVHGLKESDMTERLSLSVSIAWMFFLWAIRLLRSLPLSCLIMCICLWPVFFYKLGGQVMQMKVILIVTVHYLEI